MAISATSTVKIPFGKHLAVLLLVLLATFAVYGRVYDHLFLTEWDDPEYLVNNFLAHGLSLEHVKGAFRQFFVGNYAPLHIISYMVDYTLWGLRPVGYLLENVFIHGLNGFLLYLLVQRLSGKTVAAIFAALIFVSHPVQVEAVAWISQRKSVLSLLFFLLSLLCYLTYRDEKSGTQIRYYWLSIVFFAASLLVKSAAVVLPITLLLFDRCFENRRLRSALSDKIPYFAAAAVTALLTLYSQSPEYGGGRAAFHGGTPIATFFTMLPVLVGYLRLFFWPSGLSAAYSPEIKSVPDLEVMLAALLLTVLLAGAVFLFGRDRRLFCWLAIALVGFLPVAQIVPLVTMMNDRYLYFPMIGLAPFMALGCAQLAERYHCRLRLSGTVLAILLVFVLGLVANQRARFWHDSTTLWTDAVSKVPNSFMANYVLASIKVKSARLEEAHPLLVTLSRMDPQNPKVYELWGHFYYQAGNLQQAEASYLAAIAKNPRRPKSQLYLGNIYLGQGRATAAMERFRAAEKVDPLSPDIAYSIACAESLQQHSDTALEALLRAFQLGFRECRAVAVNPELDFLRNRSEFTGIMDKFCSGNSGR